MKARWQMLAIVFTASSIGTVVAVVSYIAAIVLSPDPIEYTQFTPLATAVRVGDAIEILAGYHKRFDCHGRAIVELDDGGQSPGYSIFEQPIGNREPGSWTVVRRFKIPATAEPGKARVREILIVECSWRTTLVRSDWAAFDLLPRVP